MALKKAANKKRSWKMERASIRRKRVARSRSNKYSASDVASRPKAHSQKQMWVGGYTRADGTRVKGYYRVNFAYSRRKRKRT